MQQDRQTHNLIGFGPRRFQGLAFSQNKCQKRRAPRERNLTQQDQLLLRAIFDQPCGMTTSPHRLDLSYHESQILPGAGRQGLRGPRLKTKLKSRGIVCVTQQVPPPTESPARTARMINVQHHFTEPQTAQISLFNKWRNFVATTNERKPR